MLRGDTQVQAGGHSVMPGIVRGVEKRTMRPIVDGIVSGLPRKAVPSAATPTETCMTSATKIPHAAFGSGVYGEGAGRPSAASAEPKKGRGRPKRPETPPEKEAAVHGTTKGEMRKTARKAYEK